MLAARDSQAAVLIADLDCCRKKPRPGRVAVALAEYSHKDDWMSKTLLRHYLASVIQVHNLHHQCPKQLRMQLA